MKTFLTISIPVMITAAAVISFRSFIHADYYTSAALTAIAYVSTSIWIAMMGDKRTMAPSGK